ncbi:MAG: DUF1624 domain-containing protein [Gemmatimonadaceae bacterium]
MSSASSVPRPTPARSRVASLDIVRGVVVVLMAIDHVRVYSGQPAGGPTAGIFFTRWITHFVAPAFLFLAGTGAFLYGRRVNNRGKLARFLVTRGLWLVFLELTVLRVAWTFNFDFAHYLLAGVIWMIGWCMVLMAGIVFLPYAAIATLGVGMILLHNVTDFFPALQPAMRQGALAPLWSILYAGGGFRLGAGGPPLIVLFVIVPWVGVMATGYAFGPIMTRAPEERRSISLKLGIALTAAFVLLRAIDVYGDPRPWNHPPIAQQRAAATPPARPQSAAPAPAAPAAAAGQANQKAARPAPPSRTPMPAALRFLNTNKYPASLLFLLMTLGPMLVLLGLVERARGPIAGALETFGRVPLFYYLLHIPTIHLAAVIVSLIREGSANPWLFTNHPMANPPPPAGYTWSLSLLYLVWAIVIGGLYVACKWYAGVKARSTSALLSYL